MAFGVKWNETGEESGREFAERGAASPGAGGYSPPPPTRAPGADAGAARRARRLYPPTRPQTGLEGGGGGGTKPSAIFPYSPKHTDTLPGRRLGTERSPAPLPPAPRARSPSPGLRRGSREAPRPAERGTVGSHTPLALLPLDPAVGPGEARRPGAAGYSPHDTGVFSSEAGHAEAAGSCKTQSQIKAEPGCIPGPGVTGDKVCREAAGV